MLRETRPSVIGEYDVFISHATEDKDFVGPLARALRAAGLRVWYDDFELSVGDSISAKINYGLSRSRFGLVIISRSFFTKHWAQHEMSGLIARQTSGQRLILPIWHRITKSEILDKAPPLTDIFSLNSSIQSLEEIVDAVVKRVGKIESFGLDSQPQAPATRHTGPDFAVFYIAQAHTRELSPGDRPQPSFLQSMSPPTGWLSLVCGDEQLEYVFDGTSLRVRLDWGNHWQGDEIQAYHLVSGNEPFALTIRPVHTDQIYLPSIVNSSPSRSWMGPQSRSGWMVFKIQR